MRLKASQRKVTAASEQILKEWIRMPKDQRPLGWIRYLADIGYLAREAMAALEENSTPPYARSA